MITILALEVVTLYSDGNISRACSTKWNMFHFNRTSIREVRAIAKLNVTTDSLMIDIHWCSPLHILSHVITQQVPDAFLWNCRCYCSRLGSTRCNKNHSPHSNTCEVIRIETCKGLTKEIEQDVSYWHASFYFQWC